MISKTDSWADADRGNPSSRPPTNAKHWTVAELLDWTKAYFDRIGLPSPRLDAELLLAHAMGCSRVDLYTGYQQVVEESERCRFRAFVERRAGFEPVAYIVGKREFYSLELEVGSGVLIPRPETETLVDRVLEEIRGEGESLSAPAILDLGTGSGCISVALAHELPSSSVDAVDISPEALDVARRNATRHELEGRIRFLAGDLFEPFLKDEPRPIFDVIVSNPPYVAPAEYGDLMPDVRDHEPALALVDRRDQDGLGYYRIIAREGPGFLRSEGLLALEFGESQSEAVRTILQQAGWCEIEITSDYAGIDRIITARRS
jgi:release factor glutamine methyltransferase